MKAMALRLLCVVGLAGALALSGCGGTSPVAPTTPGTTTSPVALPPPPPPVTSATPVLSLVGVNPGSGAEVAVHAEERFELEFDVAWPDAIPDARLLLEWLDTSGTRCFAHYTDPRALEPRVVTRIQVSRGVSRTGWDCALPHATTRLRATLLRHKPIDGGRIEAITYLSTDHTVNYQFREYPRPPLSAAPVAPAIESLRWTSNVPTCGTSCFPLDDEVLFITCLSRASDGEPLTSSITITWSDGVVVSGTQAYPAGASSGPRGVEHRINSVSVGAPSMSATCTVTNTRGQSVTRTISGPG